MASLDTARLTEKESSTKHRAPGSQSPAPGLQRRFADQTLTKPSRFEKAMFLTAAMRVIPAVRRDVAPGAHQGPFRYIAIFQDVDDRRGVVEGNSAGRLYVHLLIGSRPIAFPQTR